MVLPEKVRRNALISRFNERFFQKISLTSVVLCCMMRFLERKCTSCQKWRCPNNFAKKRPGLGKHGTVFGFLVKTPPPLRWGALSPRRIGCSTQNYKRKCLFFKEISDRPRYEGLILRLPGNDRKLGNRFQKKGAKTAPPKNQQLFRFEIKCRLWFCIQTYLSQRFDQVMVVRRCTLWLTTLVVLYCKTENIENLSFHSKTHFTVIPMLSTHIR